jgi:membrane-bound serine protease (ClpP class)
MKRWRGKGFGSLHLLVISGILLVAGLWADPAGAQDVARITLDKPIHPITAEYVVKALEEANAKGAPLVLLVIDTPGGYVTSVEKIQRAILQSKTPVVAYIAPAGGRAASGGAFVALACDAIAMAPGTSIGSAHPVSGLPIPLPTQPPAGVPGQPGKDQPAQPSKEAEVGMEKMVNDLAAHMRSIASNRGRNPELAEKMVRESISLTEQEALKGSVIEFVAKDEGEVMEYVRSHPLHRFDGREERVVLGPATAAKDIPMTGRQRFLSALADPSLAYVLFLLGVLGLFVEFKSPGLIFPGILGGICLLLYLMSIPLLPINVVGLLLIVLGLIFFILEVKVVSYGMLAIGGVVSLVIGSLVLYSGAPVPELALPLSVVLPVALGFAAIIIFLLTLAAKAFREPVVTGEGALVGQEGEVREPIEPPKTGKVFVLGEYWNATSDRPLERGARITVVSRHGMVLKVVPLQEGGP